MEINFMHNGHEVNLWSHPAEKDVFYMEGKGPKIYKGDSLAWFGITNVRVLCVKKIAKRLRRIEVQRHKDKP